MKTVKDSDLEGLIGTEIGVSDWAVMDQDRINVFADVTEDHQFIHIDEAAAQKTPFGGTIAHGFLTLSMLSKFSEGSGLVIEGTKMGVNYGFEKVRFLAPVPSGSKIRGRFNLKNQCNLRANVQALLKFRHRLGPSRLGCGRLAELQPTWPKMFHKMYQGHKPSKCQNRILHLSRD